MNHDPLFTQAELTRRFYNALLPGRVQSIHSEGVVVQVPTAASPLDSPVLPVYGRRPQDVVAGEAALLLCPQGNLNQGVVILPGPDPRITPLEERVEQLEQALAAIARRLTGLEQALDTGGRTHE